MAVSLTSTSKANAISSTKEKSLCHFVKHFEVKLCVFKHFMLRGLQSFNANLVMQALIMHDVLH